ncbi:hypothetical protein JMJ35_000633 [Cladonia borealis]|uniref:Lysophospholipase n=1 Tax=Cladonia borealis TaxID=184061 RepID=A0AA39RBM2_9LECA|nr:hypothetical protein JMJ35_000633 [Cladonia borealis]
MYLTFSLLLISFLDFISSAPVVTSGYAPVPAVCPSTPLVRTATGISSSESAYLASRLPIASAALGKWLQKVNPSFSTSNLPVVALTTSGGGLRSLLTGAGVVQAFDSRDTDLGTSGLYQGLTYQAGLSGGGWFLSSLAGNNYPTISSLEANLWTPAFADSFLVPANLAAAPAVYEQVVVDILAKQAAGYSPTIVDPYGRLLSYQLLYGPDGGVTDQLASITGLSNFTSHNVPFPIITALNVETSTGVCLPPNNTVIYEFSPYEFGSFDSGVNAFTQTQYLGSILSNGAPVIPGHCETNFDNLGFILGTSSDVFNALCTAFPADATGILANFSALINETHALTFMDEFAIYPNPFYNYPHSSLVSSQKNLTLVDGGESNQNNPLFPLLQPSRNINVILVNDNSADTSANFPDGSELYQTYMQAQLAGLTKMPTVPPTSVFLANGYNIRPTFFGCNDNTKITIVYLPNHNYTFPSGESTEKVQYSPSETQGMIKNGQQVATYGMNGSFAECLACAVVKKTGDTLPSGCQACFTTFCYD